MVATLPTTGRATWTDRVDNWRVQDTDWVQERLILRYAGGVTAMGEGTVYYDTVEKCLMVRNSATSSAVADHACVAAAANLRVTPGASDTTVTLAHRTNPGNGLVITSTGALVVKPSIATVNNTVLIDATGISIKIGAATAKLTTSSTDLVSDKPITAPTFNGNVVATTTTNAKALTATSGTFSSNVSVTGTLGVTGNTTLGTVTADTLNFGSRTGQHINLFGTTYGIGIQASTLYFLSADMFKFYVGDAVGGTAMTIDSAGTTLASNLNVTGNITTTGIAAFNNTLYSGTRFHAGGNGAQIRLIDTTYAGVGTDNDVYMEFYGHGTTSVPGDRSGYFGFPGTSTLTCLNEVVNGGIRLQANGTGTLALVTGTSGDINMATGATGNIILNSNTGVTVFYASGAERGRVSTSFMWGKSASGSNNAGIEMIESGLMYSTTATNVVPNLFLRHNTNAAAAYIEFANSAGTTISEFQQSISPVGTKITSCTAVPPSDYRWKNDLGPITGALDRVMQLLPKHLAWKDSGKEFDGFIAHEATDVVPYLVDGEKDAVDDNDEIKGQGFNYGGLTALLTAGLQELAERVAVLESAA